MKLRPRAEVFSFKGNRVLCAPRKTYIVFPGGGIDANESAIQAAKRECQEEAGRKLYHCTVAHPPIHQIWPKDYKVKHGEGYDGGLTYWMIGSVGDMPVAPAYRHEDYEPNMDWRPVKEVIAELKKLGATSEWADDNAVRIAILSSHLKMQQKHKEAGTSPFPALSCIPKPELV